MDQDSKPTSRIRRVLDYIPQRRISVFDQIRPQRWNWYLVRRPLDRQLERQTPQPLTIRQVEGLRYFWLDGIFSAISEAFYLAYIPLFALAYGASNQQVGWIMAIGNLAGALALFPGARTVEKTGNRKSLVLWTGGGMARVALLLLALVPLFALPAEIAIVAIASLNGLRAFMANFSNPAWTAMVADIVPDFLRGRYFSMRNLTMGIGTLIFATVAGWLIRTGNSWQADPFLGYQLSFTMAFAAGMLSTYCFSRIEEPRTQDYEVNVRSTVSLMQALRDSPGYLGFVVSGIVWNFSLQIAAPFFNIYLVKHLGADAATVGIVTSMSSLAALGGQLVWGKVMDKRSAVLLQVVTGFPIVLLPVMWIFYTAPWQVGINNLVGGFFWAGFNLANFNLILQLTPDQGRARAVALYQTGVFASAFFGPIVGGYLADNLSFQFIFGLSGVGRFVAMTIFVVLTYLPVRKLLNQKVAAQPA